MKAHDFMYSLAPVLQAINKSGLDFTFKTIRPTIVTSEGPYKGLSVFSVNGYDIMESSLTLTMGWVDFPAIGYRHSFVDVPMLLRELREIFDKTPYWDYTPMPVLLSLFSTEDVGAVLLDVHHSEVASG